MSFYVEGIWRAALRFQDGTVVDVPQPGRHHHVIARARAFGYSYEAVAEAEQGFVTTRRRFVGRKEALTIAKERGQLKPRAPGQYQGPELFSEDVW